MKVRSYIAFWDDGHDRGEFVFTSCHRANSKANLADAKDTAKHKYGFNRAKCMRITQTMLSYFD